MLRIFGSLVVVAFLSGCARSVEIDQAFSTHIGEAVRVGPVSVLLTEVLEDSRCPETVQCIWAGRARFALAASVQGDRFDGELMLPGEPFGVDGYSIELLDVRPEATVESIPEGRYAVRMVVRPTD